MQPELITRLFKDPESLRDPFTKELVADVLLHRAETSGLRHSLLPRFIVASITALCGVFWSAIRYGDSRRPTSDSSTWIAAHGEWTNRTKHLLGLAANDDRELPMLVLGRPKASLRHIDSLIAKDLGRCEFRLYRPISVPAAISVIPAIISGLRHAWQTAAASGYLPPLGRTIAILYRVCLGQVHRMWWRSSGAKPSLVVFGHTGTADASALELEQQRGGAATVHLLHGISTGHAFTGVSDVLVARCGHDAEWHRRLGGYGKAISVAQERPELAQGSDRWALYTNYAHPTAFTDEAQALEVEGRVIDCVAAAARRLGKSASEILYRPHPALRMLSAETQERVLGMARRAGFRLGGDFGLPAFELVLTTPSTIVQDALCAGTMPLVIDLVGADAASVYGAYPFTCRSKDEVVVTARRVLAARNTGFQQAWNAVGPGRLPSIRELETLVKR